MEEGVGGGIDLAASCKWCKHSCSWLGHVEHRELLSTGELQTYPARSPSFVKVLVDSNLAAMATCWMVSNTPGTALSCPWIWHNANELQSFVGLSMLQEACKKIELEIIPQQLLDIPIFRSTCDVFLDRLQGHVRCHWVHFPFLYSVGFLDYKTISIFMSFKGSLGKKTRKVFHNLVL
jgi:hypothetical protein